VGITVDDFLLLIKQVRTNMRSVLNGYGVMTSNLEQKVWITEKISVYNNKHII
jgi:hypothetical protein